MIFKIDSTSRDCLPHSNFRMQFLYRTPCGIAYPDYVITGFHMMKREGEHTEEEKAVIIQTAQELSQLDTVFYSGHCTGIPAFELMKEIMVDKLIALHSGETVI